MKIKNIVVVDGVEIEIENLPDKEMIVNNLVMAALKNQNYCPDEGSN